MRVTKLKAGEVLETEGNGKIVNTGNTAGKSHLLQRTLRQHYPEINAFLVASPFMGHMFWEVWTNRNRAGKYRRIKTIKCGHGSNGAQRWGESHGLIFSETIQDMALRQQCRNSLAKAAWKLRALRGTKAEKILDWVTVSKGDCPTDAVLKAKVGRGWLYLSPRKRRHYKGGKLVHESRRHTGVGFTSSFGPDSDKSFSGYLPGLTLDEAKKLVYYEASKHW